MLSVVKKSDFDAIVDRIGGIVAERSPEFDQTVIIRQGILIEIDPVIDS